jgi:hypothetical protein
MDETFKWLMIMAVVYLLVTIVVSYLHRQQRKKQQSLSETYVAQCGHTFEKKLAMIVGKHIVRYHLPKDGSLPLCCPECLKASAIHCAGCNGIIVPGDNVCLYGGMTPGQVPKNAHVFDDDPIQLVYCAHCADNKDHIIGTWTRGKRIQYFETTQYTNIN